MNAWDVCYSSWAQRCNFLVYIDFGVSFISSVLILIDLIIFESLTHTIRHIIKGIFTCPLAQFYNLNTFPRHVHSG